MDKTKREALGVDLQGRLSGHVALKILVERAMKNGPAYNRIVAADHAVDDETDQEVVRSALRFLLSLHLQGLDDTNPQVAVRNVMVGDVLMLEGVATTVHAIVNPDKSSITIKCRNNRTWVLDRDVRVPLVARIPKWQS